MSVPAYQWAWSDHDVRAGHYRRYTRPRALAVVATAGLVVRRSTYAFAGVFPFFVAERLVRRARPARKASPPETTGLTRVPRGLDAVLMGLSRLECRRLRHHDLPFGSSVFLAADKPQRAEARP